MQLISLNKITQKQHGVFNAVDIGRFDKNGTISDLDWYAPEDCLVTFIDTIDNDSCGKGIKFVGATGEHGVCHNELFYVSLGQHVKRGQKMGKMGYTGFTDPDDIPEGTHAHWIIRIANGQYVYPLSLVNEPFIKLGVNTMRQEVIENEIRRLYEDVTGKPVSNENFVYWRDRIIEDNNRIEELHVGLRIDDNSPDGPHHQYKAYHYDEDIAEAANSGGIILKSGKYIVE